MDLNEQIRKLITECPYKMKTVGAYPSFLIDPCILPLEETKKVPITGYGRYRKVSLNSLQLLPHGHYARLIIAYLTTRVLSRPDLPCLEVATSVSHLFKVVTGQTISGGTYTNFLKNLERVLETTFTVEPTKISKKSTEKEVYSQTLTI